MEEKKKLINRHIIDKQQALIDELVGALKVALDCLGCFDPPENDAEIEGFYEDLEIIEQAIAKAEKEATNG